MTKLELKQQKPDLYQEILQEGMQIERSKQLVSNEKKQLDHTIEVKKAFDFQNIQLN